MKHGPRRGWIQVRKTSVLMGRHVNVRSRSRRDRVTVIDCARASGGTAAGGAPARYPCRADGIFVARTREYSVGRLIDVERCPALGREPWQHACRHTLSLDRCNIQKQLTCASSPCKASSRETAVNVDATRLQGSDRKRHDTHPERSRLARPRRRRRHPLSIDGSRRQKSRDHP